MPKKPVQLVRLTDSKPKFERTERCRDSVAWIGFTTTYNNAGTAKIPVSRTKPHELWVGLWVGISARQTPPYRGRGHKSDVHHFNISVLNVCTPSGMNPSPFARADVRVLGGDTSKQWL